MLKVFLILQLIVIPTVIFAYLDPGTGTALISLLIAGIVSIMFFMKGFIFRLFKKKLPQDKIIVDEKKVKIAFFSEGRQYWLSFKSIVDSLIEKKICFSYFTLDPEDPALSLESDFIKAKFLGFGSVAYAKASIIEAGVLLSTTPNIGAAGYPVRRPEKVENMIHFFHSITDISVYKKNSLDYYDTVFSAGSFQNESIRNLEKLRNLPDKEIIPLGLPYLDEFLKDKKETTLSEETRKTILIGSSWGDKGCLKSYGVDFIKDIAKAGYDVIIRPHPHSIQSETEMIKKYKADLKSFKNITWDEQLSPSESLNKADLLISDTSSIRFDFAFIYEKPVITLSIKAEEMKGYEREFLEKSWSDEAEKNIGVVIDKDSISKIVEMIEKCISDFDSSKIASFRNETLVNFGEAGKAIAEYLEKNYWEKD